MVPLSKEDGILLEMLEASGVLTELPHNFWSIYLKTVTHLIEKHISVIIYLDIEGYKHKLLCLNWWSFRNLKIKKLKFC